MKSLDNYWTKNLLSRSEMKTIIAGNHCSGGEQVANCWGADVSALGHACVSSCINACDECKDLYGDDLVSATCGGGSTTCC